MRKAILVLALAMPLLAGCGDFDNRTTVSPSQNENTTNPELLSSSRSQEVYEVPFRELRAFLGKHNGKRICSICPVDRGAHGVTSSFIVVIEEEK